MEQYLWNSLGLGLEIQRSIYLLTCIKYSLISLDQQNRVGVVFCHVRNAFESKTIREWSNLPAKIKRDKLNQHFSSHLDGDRQAVPIIY